MHALLNKPVFVALAIMGGVLLPWLLVLVLARFRQDLVVRQFRGKLTLFANSFREGRTFADAVHLLSDRGPRPLSKEFQNLSRRLGQGEDLGDIVREMCRRIPCFEAEYLAAAVLCGQVSPEQLDSSLLRLEQLSRNKKLARERVISLCSFARQGIRAALLLGPILLAVLVEMKPAGILRSLFPMASSPAGWLFPGGVLVSAVWLVLILQKQDEAEIVLD